MGNIAVDVVLRVVRTHLSACEKQSCSDLKAFSLCLSRACLGKRLFAYGKFERKRSYFAPVTALSQGNFMPERAGPSGYIGMRAFFIACSARS
eukprot:COSAG06_NODE_895_length_11669_cov_5.131384_6_plen_93_part_00